MKIYIMTDLEGPALVSRWKQTRDTEDEPEMKREAMRFLTGEVNASVDGILDVEPNAEVVVWDAHGSGGIDMSMIHPKAKLISRGPIRAPYYLDGTYDALFFVGQHAMAGTENAPLCHTYSSRSIEYYKINGRFVGEFGARAIMAGTFGVPTVLIAGDDKAVAEAREMVPGIHGAVVKWGLGIELAMHLSHPAACELLRKVSAEAVRDIPNIPPVKLDPPYIQEIRMKDASMIGRFLKQGAERIDDRTVVLRSDDICKLRV